jgi:uncharacterized protein (TIGR02594 family)
MKKVLLLSLLLCACEPLTDQSIVEAPKSNIVHQASSFVSLHERRDRTELRDFMGIDPVRYEWCAAFVNAILASQGIPGSESVSDYPLTARSFLRWGLPVPKDNIKTGDIVVFPRGNQGWQGHVGIFVTSYYRDNKLYYVILGGNQNDEVSYELYPASTAIGIRRWITQQESSV